MRKPFLERPEAWTRPARTMQSRADYACAVERAAPRAEGRHVTDWVIVCILAAVCIWLAMEHVA